MKKIVVSLLGVVLAVAAPAFAVDRTGISGDYLEARTADVYTGPCFANGEVNLTGKEAVLAWRVRSGSWEGVSLEGLNVVAVVKASATLGDPHANPLPARSVIVVDERATAEQERALAAFARSMGGDLLKDVMAVRKARIEAEFDSSEGHAVARVRADDWVQLETRALLAGDHFCGNEYVYYPPLTEVENAIPAYTLAHTYRGSDLASTWSCPSKRSAFIGSFSR
jgi:hypothetical protein